MLGTACLWAARSIGGDGSLSVQQGALRGSQLAAARLAGAGRLSGEQQTSLLDLCEREARGVQAEAQPEDGYTSVGVAGRADE